MSREREALEHLLNAAGPFAAIDVSGNVIPLNDPDEALHRLDEAIEHAATVLADTPSVEPAGLDVERLARALPEHYSTDRGAHHSCIAYAESIAAEYDRLLPTQASDSPEKP